MPLYFQAALHLQQMIADGDLAPGTRLPNEAELATQLRVSRPTVRRAVSHLVEQGLLVRRRGAGVRVVAPSVRRKAELTSLFDDLARHGGTPRTEVRGLVVGPVPADVATRSGIPAGTMVTSVERLRFAGDEPLALMTNVVPCDVLAPDAAMLREKGLYQLLRDAGCVPVAATQVVGARAASATEAGLLDEPRGAPLLTMTRTAWDDRGRLVEYGAHLYRASRYSFELDLGGGGATPVE
ncbi:GntR family transcriptional regulator [Actinomycetospora chiangmaiensis]|uniref:GntR family transcriptional regulator n=1 Tax=Actinomycetospora chiangmaiensis TaxID=402650 RepID=UPI00035C83EA|nr:GntR family transcriptional regulator [Actinomycetospora chiangmaiensis]